MRKLANFIVKHRLIFIIVFAALAVGGGICMPFVGVNYDATKYLPKDSGTTQGLEVMEAEFGNNGSLTVLAKDLDFTQAVKLKRDIAAVKGVKEGGVLWLDDVMLEMKDSFPGGSGMTDDDFLNVAGGMIEKGDSPLLAPYQAQIETFYKDGNALFQVLTEGSAYDASTAEAIREIQKLGDMYYTGPAATAYSNITFTQKETTLAMIILIPLIAVILLLATTSFWEPVLFAMVIGVSILINMGSNLIMGEVSYLTQAVAAILQLALAMDYSIFLLNRFKQEKNKGLSPQEAMTEALVKSFSPISASSLTTVAGFVALMFMRYTIGLDMGIVLAKGIVLSLLSVFLFMPGIILYTHKLIEKTEHKSLNPTFQGFAKLIKKTRFVLPVLLVALIVPSYLAQSANHFEYGDFAASGGPGTKLLADKQEIEASFGRVNNLAILVPKSREGLELELSRALASEAFSDCVQSVQSLSLIEGMTGGMELPESMAEQFESANYTRIVVNLSVDEEGAEAFDAIRRIRTLLSDKGGGEVYMLGASASALEIKEVVEYDFTIVTWVSMGLIALILLLTFKSLLLPVLLVAVIQGSIWINMAIPYLAGQPMFFVGYMIVTCIQMGATIDYGILLTSRYLENRRTMDKFEAVQLAIMQSTKSIITSAGILCAAGFTVGLACSLPSTSVLGMAIGRGALSSLALMLIMLPQLLMIFDKPVRYTLWKGPKLMIPNPKRQK